ncbi:hypothetical protein ARMSODRAFT_961170 [Armillaria solidipes]|uniref:DUF4238 domain-containing protein n=1 Tax=Armillaria solidipes TaxID=1076256 RepID=A0A2H3BNP6_9AGAR|nr:hypothetical protein ARMSODRAFT_961170 [Armillaria solidipes]
MTEPSLVPTPKADRDHYHHVIPRFILRKFQVGGQMSKKQRQKAFKRTGREPGEVLFYDLTARTIQTRPIATVYGVTNLYKNVRYPFNVNHLEEKLSRLESNAADVTLQMHEAVDKGGSFTITRQKLDDLRQFLFLAHYRTVALSVSDANSDHPGNALVAEQLKRFGESLALSTSSQIWHHFLHYFLDAPITYDGASFINRLDLANYTDTEISPRNVDIPHIPAAIYQRQAGMFYLAVCQPADDEEFVLTNNGLGLWEGLSEQCHIHRVFVVGPRLAIILRNNVVDSQASPRLKSTLADIPLPRPTCLYGATSDTPSWQEDDITSADQYRMSEQAQMDEFTFHITKLTSQQTFDVNSFLLRNEHDDGSITFTSKEFMMKTLEHYIDTASILEDPYKSRYDSALSQLRSELHRPPSPSSQTEGGFRKGETGPEAGFSPSVESTSSHSAATAAGPHASPPRSKRSKKSNPRIVQLARSGAETLTMSVPHPSGSSRVSVSEDRNGSVTRPVAESNATQYSDQYTEALDELMIKIITRQISFFSPYEQAYRLYILFTAVQPPVMHPFAKDCDRMLSEITSRFQQLLKPPNRGVRPRPNASSPVPQPRADPERWALLLVLLEMLGFGNAKNPRNSWEEMCRGVVAVGLSTWMVKNRPDVLAALHFA